MRTAFYTIISNNYYQGCRTDEFIKSFKKFHPDIELVVYGQKEIDEEFNKNPKLNFYNCKATFGKKLCKDYDLVVSMDADHLVFDRFTEVLMGDYDVGAVSNYNAGWNCGIKFTFFNSDGHFGPADKILIPWDCYYNAGLIASTKTIFWELLEYACLELWNLCIMGEQDIYNVMLKMFPFGIKVLEGHTRFDNPNFLCHYGVSSQFQERNFVVKDKKIMLNGKQIKTYHFATGCNPKPHPEKVFPKEVYDFIYQSILT